MYYIRIGGTLSTAPYDSGNPGVRVLEKEIALELIDAESGSIIHSNKQGVYFAVYEHEIKKCHKRKDAEAWITEKKESAEADLSNDEIFSDNDDFSGYAFCDGSYQRGKIGSGYVLVEESSHDKTVTEKSFRVPYSDLRNVSGELSAALNAAKTAYQHGLRKLTIYHDFDGISYFSRYRGSNKELRDYADGMAECLKKMDISFVKIHSRSGIELNEKADFLAKEACK